MKKPNFPLSKEVPDLALEPAGFAHALNLLLLAIAASNPSVAALLDEFTAMHAEYFAELQALDRESEEHRVLFENFSQAAKLIYKRLSALDTEQASPTLNGQPGLAASLLVH